MNLNFFCLYRRPIAQYNSLTDRYLQGYFSKELVKNHLRHSGLINGKDEIIPDEIWKKRVLVEEKMELTSRIIADKIVQRAIELSNQEKLEIKRKLELVSKRELVRRIRVFITPTSFLNV